MADQLRFQYQHFCWKIKVVFFFFMQRGCQKFCTEMLFMKQLLQIVINYACVCVCECRCKQELAVIPFIFSFPPRFVMSQAMAGGGGFCCVCQSAFYYMHIPLLSLFLCSINECVLFTRLYTVKCFPPKISTVAAVLQQKYVRFLYTVSYINNSDAYAFISE